MAAVGLVAEIAQNVVSRILKSKSPVYQIENFRGLRASRQTIGASMEIEVFEITLSKSLGKNLTSRKNRL